ncbi:MAG TPA: hypothetical protein VL988_12255, partial [Solirubrobacteraceae bacterium]|nr:hypothetical protein [Solirubrobacteraceae bacterium]
DGVRDVLAAGARRTRRSARGPATDGQRGISQASGPICSMNAASARTWVAARRPTVSGALSALERSGLVEQTSEGWMLSGSPPSELPTVAELSPDGASSAASQTT